METATKATWKNHPIVTPKRIALKLFFSAKQFERLQKGLIPAQMEDKWFIYFEEPWLYFHRSWTGFGIYKTHLEREGEGHAIREFWVERSHEKYKNEDDDADIETFLFLISRGLLGLNVNDFYAGRNIKSETDALKGWGNFGQLLFTNKGLDYTGKIKAVLFGVAVGDALGVPVEFKSREIIREKPVTEMIGYGTYNLPAGTFSDDSSLTFCLAEGLTRDFDLQVIRQQFVKWYQQGYWTARGNVFDVGNATRYAIERLAQGVQPDLAGSVDASSNGNGSLMRIAPLLFYMVDMPVEERYEITRQVSSMTHAHIRSVIACFYYLEFARQLLTARDKMEIYGSLQNDISAFLKTLPVDLEELKYFDRLLKGNIYEFPEDEIFSTGYVLFTLEASIWCLLTTDNYKDAVLKAVNLGDDTDTTAAVTGGLAGLLYGLENIPGSWMEQLARKEDIDDLAERMADKLYGR